MYGEDFINTLNEYYPFERYIVNEPKSIDNLFDDAVLTEIFIPAIEISNPDNFHIPKDEIYVKVLCKGVEIRLGFYDFSEHVQENIIDIVYRDFGECAWECMYCESEDDNEYLINTLSTQIQKIKSKYGECNIKKYFDKTKVLNIVNSIKDNVNDEKNRKC